MTGLIPAVYILVGPGEMQNANLRVQNEWQDRIERGSGIWWDARDS
jgi:hypothetical protein